MSTKSILNSLEEHINLSNEIKLNYIEKINSITNVIYSTITNNNNIFWCGNGGSASDAQHIAAEFVGRFSKNRQPLNSISLNTDTSVITCIANDFGYENIFARQLEALSKKNDLLICFSTSGNSRNIIKAIEYAKNNNLKIITFLGKTGGNCSGLTEYEILIPSNTTARIQEMHITIAHIICEIIDDKY
tara:strand:- start:118 stop:684 length:567 start_codon:yes stop_codon:yes gene_type:complete